MTYDVNYYFINQLLEILAEIFYVYTLKPKTEKINYNILNEIFSIESDFYYEILHFVT